MNSILVLMVMFLVNGCAQNSVTERHASPPVILYDKEAEWRFGNVYPEHKSYPVTCEKHCYPASSVVSCESPGENCTYTGVNKNPQLNIGFDVHWLGHASFKIIDKNDNQILLDPVSKQFDWPVDWAFSLTGGLFRQEPKWPDEGTINNTNAVLYSHIHYDHFNKSDISRIGNKAKYFVPLKFADHFESGGYDITEMSWYAQTQVNDLKIHFVPAHHFSSRIMVPYIYNDDDKTLWGGWVLESGGKRLFFAGDTGYSQHFKDIRQRIGAMDVCLLPIASYFHPKYGKWYRYVHTTPEDALVAAKELECKITIPFGYGNNSWKMGDHSTHSPLLRLLHMHKKLKSDVALYILNEGEQIAL